MPSCGNLDNLSVVNAVISYVINNYSKMMGDTTEQLTHKVATELEDFKDTGFTPATTRGFDHVFKDKDNNCIIVMDSKGHVDKPFGSLKPTKRGIQLSGDWVVGTARLTGKEHSELNKVNPAQNTRVYEMIMDARERGALKTYISWLNPSKNTLEWYELIDEDNPRSVKSWKFVKSWSADEIERLYPDD